MAVSRARALAFKDGRGKFRAPPEHTITVKYPAIMIFHQFSKLRRHTSDLDLASNTEHDNRTLVSRRVPKVLNMDAGGDRREGEREREKQREKNRRSERTSVCGVVTVGASTSFRARIMSGLFLFVCLKRAQFTLTLSFSFPRFSLTRQRWLRHVQDSRGASDSRRPC